ncbi:TolC family protein [Bdellovibrionota bacterium FG-2]
MKLYASRTPFFSFVVLSLLPLVALASAPPELSFSDVWSHIAGQTPSEKAVASELEASLIAAARSQRHWFPVLYLDAKGYDTNDPGAALFSKLSQRQISPSDFSPDLMNHPGAQLTEKLTLGLNLPLYEGGVRKAHAQIDQTLVQAKGLEEQATKQKMYLETARIFQSLTIEARALKNLSQLEKVLIEILARYRLGSKANPVGYSGLLGLQSLRNKIAGLMLQKQAKMATYYGALRKMSQDASNALPEKWEPQDEDVIEFSRNHLNPMAATEMKNPGSLRLQSMETAALASDQAIAIEKAKFLPRFGLFAESSLNHGSRDTAVSHTGGAYLQWDLFSASNFGAVHQAQAASAATHSRVQEAKIQEEIQTLGSKEASGALEKGLKLLTDSARLLEEQTEVARKLFKGGAMNALQFSEVLNRRADLLSAIDQTETQYLNAQITLSESGASNE